MISHWDEARTWRGEKGHIAGTWSRLTGAESGAVGLKRIRVDPGKWSTPLHLEGAEEEIFFVLAGSGISVQWDGEQTTGCDVRAGDCLVHLPLENAHTLEAAEDGLDVLAFGERALAGGVTLIPRAGVSWLGASWARVGADQEHPWTAEAAVGPPEVDELSPRPANVVNVEDVEPVERVTKTIGRRWRSLSDAAGSRRTGLRHCQVLPGLLSVPPHCHAAEDEIFVVLEGEGHLLLWGADGVTEHPVLAGSIVARRAGTGVAHSFRGGEAGLTLLAYGNRDPRDICFYPRSGKVYFSGLDLCVRLGERVDFWDGED